MCTSIGSKHASIGCMQDAIAWNWVQWLPAMFELSPTSVRLLVQSMQVLVACRMPLLGTGFSGYLLCLNSHPLVHHLIPTPHFITSSSHTSHLLIPPLTSSPHSHTPYHHLIPSPHIITSSSHTSHHHLIPPLTSSPHPTPHIITSSHPSHHLIPPLTLSPHPSHLTSSPHSSHHHLILTPHMSTFLLILFCTYEREYEKRMLPDHLPNL